MFRPKPKKKPWQSLSKGLIYGGFGLSSFLTAFILRRMLQVRYYKQLEEHEKRLKSRKMTTLAVMACFVLLGLALYTPFGNEMAASLFTNVHH